MRLLIIRHGDPDYANDSLTEKGWKEAEMLAEKMAKEDVKAFYVSPLGRAKDTASLTLKKMGRTATECTWLREFACKIMRPDRENLCPICWDWLPEHWTKDPVFYDREQWLEHKIMQDGHVKEEYEWVTSSFDELLKAHGYERDGRIYKAVKPNRDTIVFFCHQGLECVLLSHLMNVSPMVLWHHMCAAPTSVTTVYTEERREGKATFRITSFGDVSHLYVKGEKPSFMARFCETYHNNEGEIRG